MKKRSKKVPVRKKSKNRHINIDSAYELSSEIERLYRIEKKRIENSSLQLEREKLKAYLRLMDKRKDLIKSKMKEMKSAEDTLRKNERSISRKVADLKAMNTKEKKQLDLLYLLNEQLANIEKQTKKIILSRKGILNHEQLLFRGLKHSIVKNKENLKYSGADEFKKIDDIVNQKEKILKRSAKLLDDDMSHLFMDKKYLEKITDNQLNKIYKINLQLQKLTKGHEELSKKLEKLKSENLNYLQGLNDIKHKGKKFISELKDKSNRMHSS